MLPSPDGLNTSTLFPSYLFSPSSVPIHMKPNSSLYTEYIRECDKPFSGVRLCTEIDCLILDQVRFVQTAGIALRHSKKVISMRCIIHVVVSCLKNSKKTYLGQNDCFIIPKKLQEMYFCSIFKYFMTILPTVRLIILQK